MWFHFYLYFILIFHHRDSIREILKGASHSVCTINKFDVRFLRRYLFLKSQYTIKTKHKFNTYFDQSIPRYLKKCDKVTKLLEQADENDLLNLS